MVRVTTWLARDDFARFSGDGHLARGNHTKMSYFFMLSSASRIKREQYPVDYLAEAINGISFRLIWGSPPLGFRALC